MNGNGTLDFSFFEIYIFCELNYHKETLLM